MISSPPIQKYDSGWFAVSNGTEYVKSHTLNSQNLKVTVLFAPDVAGSPDLTNIFKVDSEISAAYAGCTVFQKTATEITLITANDKVAQTFKIPPYYTNYTSGHYRILAVKI